MASDSARLLDAAAQADPRPRPRPKGPARPILKGVGLDAPFFADKNKAFWVLQSIGWTGYFTLRSLSGIAKAISGTNWNGNVFFGLNGPTKAPRAGKSEATDG